MPSLEGTTAQGEMMSWTWRYHYPLETMDWITFTLVIISPSFLDITFLSQDSRLFFLQGVLLWVSFRVDLGYAFIKSISWMWFRN
jgi:hypothetical protein